MTDQDHESAVRTDRPDSVNERRAKELALYFGGKIAVVNSEGACTNAYLILIREGQWRWPRGLHTGDLLTTYVELHWRDFLDQAVKETVTDDPLRRVPLS
jgi:hypothetical protein